MGIIKWVVFSQCLCLCLCFMLVCSVLRNIHSRVFRIKKSSSPQTIELGYFPGQTTVQMPVFQPLTLHPFVNDTVADLTVCCASEVTNGSYHKKDVKPLTVTIMPLDLLFPLPTYSAICIFLVFHDMVISFLICWLEEIKKKIAGTADSFWDIGHLVLRYEAVPRGAKNILSWSKTLAVSTCWRGEYPSSLAVGLEKIEVQNIPIKMSLISGNEG